MKSSKKAKKKTLISFEKIRVKTYTPFFEKGNIHLYLADSIEFMNRMKPEQVDMIFADPPYNLSNGGFTVHAGKRVSVNKGEWDTGNL